jgi:hypothetical protein
VSATTCDVCGSNKYFAREFGRVRDEAVFWRLEAEKLGARVAQLELAAKLAEHRDRTDVAWLQGKVVAQRRELKALNDRRNLAAIKSNVDPLPEDVEVLSVTRTEVDSRYVDAAREARKKVVDE